MGQNGPMEPNSHPITRWRARSCLARDKDRAVRDGAGEGPPAPGNCAKAHMEFEIPARFLPSKAVPTSNIIAKVSEGAGSSVALLSSTRVRLRRIVRPRLPVAHRRKRVL